jgi:hypothetical protein
VFPRLSEVSAIRTCLREAREALTGNALFDLLVFDEHYWRLFVVFSCPGESITHWNEGQYHIGGPGKSERLLFLFAGQQNFKFCLKLDSSPDFFAGSAVFFNLFILWLSPHSDTREIYFVQKSTLPAFLSGIPLHTYPLKHLMNSQNGLRFSDHLRRLLLQQPRK